MNQPADPFGQYSDDYDAAGSTLNLPELLREIEGSTHGGPRHAALYQSLQTLVENDPAGSLDAMNQLPTSAKSVMLMAISGLGRRILVVILECLRDECASQREDAAMILCIWATRGLLSGADRESILGARSQMPPDGPAVRYLDDALSRLRT